MSLPRKALHSCQLDATDQTTKLDLRTVCTRTRWKRNHTTFPSTKEGPGSPESASVVQAACFHVQKIAGSCNPSYGLYFSRAAKATERRCQERADGLTLCSYIQAGQYIMDLMVRQSYLGSSSVS